MQNIEKEIINALLIECRSECNTLDAILNSAQREHIFRHHIFYRRSCRAQKMCAKLFVNMSLKEMKKKLTQFVNDSRKDSNNYDVNSSSSSNNKCESSKNNFSHKKSEMKIDSFRRKMFYIHQCVEHAAVEVTHELAASRINTISLCSALLAALSLLGCNLALLLLYAHKLQETTLQSTNITNATHENRKDNDSNVANNKNVVKHKRSKTTECVESVNKNLCYQHTRSLQVNEEESEKLKECLNRVNKYECCRHWGMEYVTQLESYWEKRLQSHESMNNGDGTSSKKSKSNSVVFQLPLENSSSKSNDVKNEKQPGMIIRKQKKRQRKQQVREQNKRTKLELSNLVSSDGQVITIGKLIDAVAPKTI